METVRNPLRPGQRFIPHGLFIGSFIPNCIMRNKDLSQTAKLVWGRLAQYAGKDGDCFPALSTLAEEVGSSRRSVIRAIEELVDYGFIGRDIPTQVDRGRRKTNNYWFLWHKSMTGAEMTPVGCPTGEINAPVEGPTGAEMTPVQVSKWHVTGVKMTPKENHLRESSEEDHNHHPCHDRSNPLEEELPDPTESGGGDALLSEERREKLSPRETKRYIDLKVAHQKAHGGFTTSEARYRSKLKILAGKGELDTCDFDELLEWEREEREWRAMDEESEKQAEQERRKKEAEELERQSRAEEEQHKAGFERAKAAITEYVENHPGMDASGFTKSVLEEDYPTLVQFFDDGFEVPMLREACKELYPTEYQGAEDAKREEHKARMRKLFDLPSPAGNANGDGSSVCIERKPKDGRTQIKELIMTIYRGGGDIEPFRINHPREYQRAMAEVHHG